MVVPRIVLVVHTVGGSDIPLGMTEALVLPQCFPTFWGIPSGAEFLRNGVMETVFLRNIA